MKFNRMSRRMFLQGASGALLPIPTLLSLLPKEARAQSTPQPYRAFINMVTNYDYGTHVNWFGETAMNLNSAFSPLTSPGEHAFGYRSLRSLRNSNLELSRIFGTHLNSFIDHATLIRGLDYGVETGHSPSGAIGNVNGAAHQVRYGRQLPTIVQIVNRNTAFNPGGSDVLVAPAGTNGDGSVTYQLNGTLQGGTGGSTRELYNAIFRNNSVPETAGGDTSTPPHPRYDLLNDVLEDYNRIRTGGQVSRDELKGLTDIMDQPSTVRGQMAGIQRSTMACNYRGLQSSTVYNELYYAFMTDRRGDLTVLTNILLAAMMCSLYRTIHIPFGIHDLELTQTVGDNNYSNTAPPGQLEGSRHDFHAGVTHTPFNTTTRAGVAVENNIFLAEWYSFYMQRVLKPLAEGMANVIDSVNGKSMLYNSLIQVGSCSSQVHNNLSLPCLLVGNAGGYIKSGYLIDYSHRFESTRRIHQNISGELTAFNGASFVRTESDRRFHGNYHGILYNRLFKTIFNSFGFPSSEYAPHLIRHGGVTSTEVPSGYGVVGRWVEGSGSTPVHNVTLADTPLPMPATSLA